VRTLCGVPCGRAVFICALGKAHRLSPSKESKMESDPLRLWTLAEAAKLAGINPRTLRALIVGGHGPKATPIGRQIRIGNDHWREWLEALAVESLQSLPYRKCRTTA
jgi:hypothetical protein